MHYIPKHSLLNVLQEDELSNWAEAAEAFTVEVQQLCKAEVNDYLNTCCITPCTSLGVWNGAKGKTRPNSSSTWAIIRPVLTWLPSWACVSVSCKIRIINVLWLSAQQQSESDDLKWNIKTTSLYSIKRKWVAPSGRISKINGILREWNKCLQTLVAVRFRCWWQGGSGQGSAPVSTAGRKLHLCSRQPAQPSRAEPSGGGAGDVTDDMFPTPRLPSLSPNLSLSSPPAFQAIHPSTHPHTHTLHMHTHTRKTLEFVFSMDTGGRWMSLSYRTAFCAELLWIWVLC